MTRLQIEEKFFTNKYFEAFKYPVTTKKNPTLKRKAAEISKHSVSRSLTQSAPQNDEVVSDELKKTKTNGVSLKSPVESKVFVHLDKTDKLEFGQIPWIIWKKNSCRIDVFATLAYHIFYYDFTESIFPTITGPALPGNYIC